MPPNPARPSGAAPLLTGPALADRLRKIAISIRFFTPAERADLLGEAAARLETAPPKLTPAALARAWEAEARQLSDSPAEPSDPLVGLALHQAASQLAQGLDRLTAEVRSRYAALHNGLVMRRDHPSYGYTKTSLRAELDTLTGVLIGHLMTGGAGWAKGGSPDVAVVEYAAAEFGIDLPGLARAIKESR